MAEKLLGSLSLMPGQMAQLRAIDHKYQQSLYTILQGAIRAPTETERSQLDAMAAREILDILTAEQRTQLGRQ